jgi:hypothetical protein
MLVYPASISLFISKFITAHFCGKAMGLPAWSGIGQVFQVKSSANSHVVILSVAKDLVFPGS